MADKQSTYRAYLLRLWREEKNGAETWRASLENAQTSERHNFGSLDELFAFVRGLANEMFSVDHEDDIPNR